LLLVAGGVALLAGLGVGSGGRYLAAVIVCAVGIAGIVLGVKGLIDTRTDDADRRVAECLAAGGIPDRYGRYGQDVTCYPGP
jgi:hypothetical protein